MNKRGTMTEIDALDDRIAELIGGLQFGDAKELRRVLLRASDALAVARTVAKFGTVFPHEAEQAPDLATACEICGRHGAEHRVTDGGAGIYDACTECAEVHELEQVSA